MQRAFVTGATGFVGSAVVRCLIQRDTLVRALVRPGSDRRNLAGLDIELVEIDMLDQSAMRRALDGCDWLFHVAAMYSTRDEDSDKMYSVNVGGTKTVLAAALQSGVKRVVHTSTIGTIGQPGDGTLATEDTPYNLGATASHYARSKYLAEAAALAMCEQGLPVVVVNPCAPVGPGDVKPSSTGQRILDYVKRKMPSFSTGGINFVPVDDVAMGHILAAEKGSAGERYILGHRDGNLSLESFLVLMEQVSGVARPRQTPRSILSWLRRTAPQSHRPTALTCDPSKAIRELGLPQTSLTTAFAAALDWFKEQGYVVQGG